MLKQTWLMADAVAGNLAAEFKKELLNVLENEPYLLMTDCSDGSIKDSVLGELAKKCIRACEFANELDELVNN